MLTTIRKTYSRKDNQTFTDPVIDNVKKQGKMYVRKDRQIPKLPKTESITKEAFEDKQKKLSLFVSCDIKEDSQEKIQNRNEWKDPEDLGSLLFRDPMIEPIRKEKQKGSDEIHQDMISPLYDIKSEFEMNSYDPLAL